MDNVHGGEMEEGSAAELSDNGLENQYRFRDRVIRDKEYKLFVSSESKPEKLVNVLADPEEKINLLYCDDPKVQAEYEKLWKVTISFPKQDSDPHYIALPKESWDKKVTVHSQVWKK